MPPSAKGLKKCKQEGCNYVPSAKLSEGGVALATSTEQSKAEAQKRAFMAAYLKPLAHDLYNTLGHHGGSHLQKACDVGPHDIVFGVAVLGGGFADSLENVFHDVL